MSSEPPRATLLNGSDGVRVGTIYDFAKAGDTLAQHSHTYGVDDHYTVIAKGAIKVSSGSQDEPSNYWEQNYWEPGPVLDHKPLPGQTIVVHEFVALTDGARIVNLRKSALSEGAA